MVKQRYYLLIFFALAVVSSLAVGQSTVTQPSTVHTESGVLGEGTNWSTPWYRIDSGVKGPTVLIIGGVHGNEPAGYRAADQIRHWPIKSGKIIVMPKLNRLGLAANMRWIPEFRNVRKTRDLNRVFPRRDNPEPQTQLGTAVWDFVKSEDPDWVFDLHEGFDFHRINSKSVGSSVISFPTNSAFAADLVKTVNNQVDFKKHFELLDGKGPIDGSLARACVEQLDAKAFIIETTFKDQPISLRAHQHRLLISTALNRIGLLDQDCADVMCPASTTKICVGIFDGTGAGEEKVVNVLDLEEDIIVNHIGPKQMVPTILSQFDVLVFPGGSGSKQAKAIGAEGREHIREFADNGGGIVGICAGAYLCSSHYPWSLSLMNASVFNQSFDIPGKGKKSMWYRGKPANIDVELTADAKAILGIDGLHAVRYHNGPILSPDNKPDVPAYMTLGYFRSENGIYKPQQGTMIGTPAIITSNYGSGKVIAISPHFESTKGLERVVGKAVRFVSESGTTVPSSGENGTNLNGTSN